MCVCVCNIVLIRIFMKSRITVKRVDSHVVPVDRPGSRARGVRKYDSNNNTLLSSSSSSCRHHHYTIYFYLYTTNTSSARLRLTFIVNPPPRTL